MKQLIAYIVILCSASCVASPELFFGPEDLPMLRERIKHPDFAYIWEEDFKLANDYLNPESGMYCDPEKFIEKWNNAGWYDRMVHSRVEVLGFVTLITGDRKYADVAVKLLEVAARNQHVSDEQRVPHRAYAMGLDWCGEYMTDEQRKLIVEAAADFARHKSQVVFSGDTWWYPYHNWIGVDIGSVGLIALKLRNDYPLEAQQWLRRSNEAIEAWFRNSFDENGAQLEGTQYYGFAFSNALRYAIAQKRITGCDILAGSEIENLPNFLSMSLLPGEADFDARNDAPYSGVRYIESSMYIYVFKSPLMMWLRENTCKDKYKTDYDYPEATGGFAPQRLLWETDIRPLSPKQLGIKKSQFFSQRGLCIWRTGWSKDDIMFSVEAGPYFPVTHNQADKGHFTLYGMGYRWAPDPGYGNNRTLGGRSQTDGHNCILIDGKGQMLSGAGLGTEGVMVRWYDDKKYGYSLADLTDAYNRTIAVKGHESSDWWKTIGRGAEHALQRELARRVYRHSLFIKPQESRSAYVVLFDDVQAVQPTSDYTWQMITWPNLEFDINDDRILLTPVDKQPDLPRLELYIDTPAEKHAAKDTYLPGDSRSPSSYPRLRVVASQTDNPRFAAVLLPLDSKTVSPTVTFSRDDKKAATVVISWPDGHREIICCPFEDRLEPTIQFELPKPRTQPEILTSVHPGKIGGRPFWNKYAFTFTYVPSFDFSVISGAASYHFAATASNGCIYRFIADTPDALLSPIWLDLPSGPVDMKVVAVDANGTVIGTSGQRSFHKGTPYAGPYRHENYDYSDSAKMALKKLFELDYINNWRVTGQPDPNYYNPAVGYQYAAKIIGAVIQGAVLYSNIEPRPSDADEILKIGCCAADYLLTRHFPEGYVLAHFPPTYDKMETRGHMNVKNVMPMDGVAVGCAYLGLFEKTRNKKYFNAAEQIADGFKRLQLENGTWYLMVEAETGKPVYPNFVNPQEIIDYLELFIAGYGRTDFQPVVDKALKWTFDNPLKTFNWQNQFEDSVPTDAYKNLTHLQACGLAKYLFKKAKDYPEYITMAKELLRYVEDQFVVWDNPPLFPPRTEAHWPAEYYATDKWLLPCVCEQYGFWQPVGGSSAILISAYQQAWSVTGEHIYLSKAEDLADTIVYAQQHYHRGQFLTYLTTIERDFWINCAVGTARTMLELDASVSKKSKIE